MGARLLWLALTGDCRTPVGCAVKSGAAAAADAEVSGLRLSERGACGSTAGGCCRSRVAVPAERRSQERRAGVRGALKAVPDFVPARTGEGYVALARQDYRRGAGCRSMPRFALRRLRACARRKRAGAAGARAATATRARRSRRRSRPIRSLVNLARAHRGAEVPEFRPSSPRRGRRCDAGRLDEARTAYQRAIAASPDSAFLYRELGMVERRRGDAAAALEHFNRAVALDPATRSALAQSRRDFLRSAGTTPARKPRIATPRARIRSPDYDRKADAAAARARESRLPAEFRALASVAANHARRSRRADRHPARGRASRRPARQS